MNRKETERQEKSIKPVLPYLCSAEGGRLENWWRWRYRTLKLGHCTPGGSLPCYAVTNFCILDLLF